MKHRSKLESEQQSEQTAEQQAGQQSAVKEFATAEELLRYDRAQSPVPPAVAERLKQSVEKLPAPNRSWWQRLFGASNP